MVWMVDIAGFTSLSIKSPSTAVSVTSSPFMTEASMSENVEVWDPSAGVGGTGKHQWKVSLSHLISRSNKKSGGLMCCCHFVANEMKQHHLRCHYIACTPYLN